jgi:arsenate reductase
VADRVYNVLFLCTGNSARSIMAETILNHLGKGRFRAFSAGSHPADQVNPLALEQVRRAGHPIDGLRSKSWNEFATPDAPALDFVFTVCDNAAGEVCPIWPGRPVTAHWGVEDPAIVAGSEDEQREAFLRAFSVLHTRITRFLSLSLAGVGATGLTRELDRIGRLLSDDK